jgi:hypothetical protein
MAKKGKTALPKRVAGIKVPKGLRKSRVLRSLLASRLGRQVVADAIVAGAGAGAAVLVGERREMAEGAKAGARKGARGLALATEAVESAASAMMEVVAEAARSMLPEEKPRKKRGTGREGADVRH